MEKWFKKSLKVEVSFVQASLVLDLLYHVTTYFQFHIIIWSVTEKPHLHIFGKRKISAPHLRL